MGIYAGLLWIHFYCHYNSWIQVEATIERLPFANHDSPTSRNRPKKAQQSITYAPVKLSERALEHPLRNPRTKRTVEVCPRSARNAVYIRTRRQTAGPKLSRPRRWRFDCPSSHVVFSPSSAKMVFTAKWRLVSVEHAEEYHKAICKSFSN